MSGTSALRDAFNLITVPHGLRCTGALMNWVTHKGKVTHRQLTFNCVCATDNTKHQFISDPLPPGVDALSMVPVAANKAIEA